ncbi:MAG: hypothetical protein QME65_03975 [Candidatus Omnitrophota bacterium]|nr:hypothetical protein [Candidatus Omnitrophota bacterium]
MEADVVVNETSNQVTVETTLSETVGFYIDKFTADGDTDTFATTYKFRPNSALVFLNGVLQEKDVDYTEGEASQSIIFATKPPASWKVEVRYAKT